MYILFGLIAITIALFRPVKSMTHQALKKTAPRF